MNRRKPRQHLQHRDDAVLTWDLVGTPYSRVGVERHHVGQRAGRTGVALMKQASDFQRDLAAEAVAN